MSRVQVVEVAGKPVEVRVAEAMEETEVAVPGLIVRCCNERQARYNFIPCLPHRAPTNSSIRTPSLRRG